MLQKKWFPIAVLFISCVPLFFLNSRALFWFGDDWTQYVKEAQNIAAGKPYYISGFIFNPANTDYAPPQYPPGYPLLLAPLVRFSGIGLQPLVSLNIVFVSALLFASYYYFRHYSSKMTAVCLAIILCYTSYIIDLKKHVLSDIPCTLFVTLYFALRGSKNLSGKRTVLLMLIGVFAMLIRSQAMLLIVAEGIIFCGRFLKDRRKKVPGTNLLQQPSLLLCVGMTLLYFFCNTVLFAAPNSTLQFYKQIYTTHIVSPWTLIGRNGKYLWELLSGILSHETGHPLLGSMITIITSAATLLGFIGCFRSFKKGLRADNVFFLLMCVLIIITPVYQGFRYLLPAVPVFLLFVKEGIKFMSDYVVKITTWKIAVGCTVLFLSTGFSDYKHALQPSAPALTADDFTTMTYLKNHIADSEIIVFIKPRFLTLYTGKKSMNLAWQENLQRNRTMIDSFKASYLLTRHDLTNDIFQQYQKQPDIFSDSVQINERYKLYRLRRY